MRGSTQGRRTAFHAIGNLTGGGAQRVVIQLLRAWPREHSQPGLLLGSASGVLLDSVPADTVVHVIPAVQDVRELAALRRHVGRILANRPATVLVSHMTGMNRALLRATWGMRNAPRVSVVEHNNLARKWQESGAARMHAHAKRIETAFLYRRAAAVIGVSQGVTGSVRQHLWLNHRRMHTLLNPVDVDAIRQRMHEPPDHPFAATFASLPRPILLAVGRLHDQKNFPALIEAFARLPAERRGSLVILGEGEREQALRASAAAWGVGDALQLPGFVSNPWWFMARADLFVMTSIMEGMPLVLVEALACGLRVISTDCDFGPREILEAAGCGSLVPVENCAALVAEIQRVLALPRAQCRPGVDTERFLASLKPSVVAQRYANLAHGVTRPHGV